VTRIIYNSHISAKQHEALGFSNHGRVILPNGFNIDEYHYSHASRLQIRAELQVEDDEFLVGAVARYHHLKGYRNLINSAALLQPDMDQLKFVLVGSGVDYTQREIVEQIEASGMLSRFRLLGERHDIPAIMSAVDLFVLPSISEAFPNVVGEAMACERPCIVTDVGDSASIVGDTGVVVPPGDPRALADAIRKFLKMDRKERAHLGEKARCRIVDRYSLSKIIEQYENLYIEVLGLTAR
jgi:glycosyltransferase involved in cell wall biosynthesis